jgi:hypothetical protein
MADHHEVMNVRLYLKEPGSERLRKTSAGRLRLLLSTGWRETERWHAPGYITVKVERSGHVPRMTRLPKPPPPQARPPRQSSGARGPGGGRGRP